MTEQVQQNIKVADSDEIDLRELFSAIWAGKWIIIATTLLFSVAAVFYALSLPNVYKSEVTLAPAGESGGLNIPGQLGGLAALAGVNLGGTGSDKTNLALQVLESRDFITQFIEKNDLYIDIMAARGWDRETDQLILDDNVYNKKSQKWVRKVKSPFKPKPSNQEAYKEFMKLLSVNMDKKNGTIKLSIEYYSPYKAKEWIDNIVIDVNEEIRNQDKGEAKLSIDFLNRQIEKTNVADVRTMLYSLIEEQTKKIMLANVRSEYVFKTIDPAIVTEMKSKPNRFSIVILVIILSVFATAFGVVIRAIRLK